MSDGSLEIQWTRKEGFNIDGQLVWIIFDLTETEARAQMAQLNQVEGECSLMSFSR